METGKIFSSVLLLVTICVVCQCHQVGAAEISLRLQLQFANARLPKATSGLRAVYDGKDSVYIFGGFGATNISRYSISADKLEHFGEFTFGLYGAAAYYEQDIIYVTDNFFNEIFRYSTVTHNYSLVNRLPRIQTHTASAWDPDNELLYLFGGSGPQERHDQILRYNPKDDSIEQVGRLPEPLVGTATWNDDRALILVPVPGMDATILEYNPLDGGVTEWPPVPVKPGTGLHGACAVTSGSGHSYFFADSNWLRLDPDNRKTEMIDVVGWDEISEAACVYVPALDRIYIFGGYGKYPETYGRSYRDEITYIDLGNPL